MVMNLYILFLISLPEAFLNAIIFLLFAGAKNKLKINKVNIISFTISISAMLVSSTIIRPIAQNVIENIILHILAYIIIFSLVYRLNFSYTALGVVLTMLLVSTISNSYFPFIIAYVSKGISNFSKNYHLFVIYQIPVRIFQIIVILYLWKYEILIITRISQRFHKAFIIVSFILIIIEYSSAYLFYTYFNILPLPYQIFNAFMLLLLVTIFNFVILQTAYVAIGDILTKGYSQYKELEYNAKFAFEEVNNLLKNDKVNEAIELINELNGN